LTKIQKSGRERYSTMISSGGKGAQPTY
jgi:hypothetical protein